MIWWGTRPITRAVPEPVMRMDRADGVVQWNDSGGTCDPAGFDAVTSTAAAEHLFHRKPARIIDDTEISPPARYQRTPVGQPEPFCRGKRCHPDGEFRGKAAFDCLPDTAVDMTALHQQVGMAVIGGKTAPGDRCRADQGDEGCDVALGRSFPDKNIHAPFQFFLCLCKGGAFVVTLEPGKDIGIEVFSGKERSMAVTDRVRVRVFP